MWYILSSFHPDAIDNSNTNQATIFTNRIRCCFRHNDNGWPTFQWCQCWACSTPCSWDKCLLTGLCLLVWVGTLAFAIKRDMDTPFFFLVVHVGLTITWSAFYGMSRILHPGTSMRRKVSFGLSLTMFIILIGIAKPQRIRQSQPPASLACRTGTALWAITTPTTCGMCWGALPCSSCSSRCASSTRTTSSCQTPSPWETTAILFLIHEE